MEKISYNMKELADLLDVGETTLQSQIIPVIRAVLAEILDQTVHTLIDQRDRIAFLEAELRGLDRRLASIEAQLFPDRIVLDTAGNEPGETDMVDLESVLGIELGAAAPVMNLDGTPTETVAVPDAVVGTIRTLRHQGQTFEQIAAHLNQEGVNPPPEKDQWDAGEVEKIATSG